MPKRAHSVATSVSDDESVDSPPTSSTPNKRRNTGSTTKPAAGEAKENRKLARKERNRISAQISRDRKKEEKESLASRLETAELQVQHLTEENKQLRAQISKNKDMEEQLDGLRLRFVELEKMMLASSRRSSSAQLEDNTTKSNSPSTCSIQLSEPVTSNQLLPKVEESETIQVERDQEVKRKPEATAKAGAETPSSSDERQDSRIGNGTHATGMPLLIICSETLSSEPSPAPTLARSSVLSPSPRRSLPQLHLPQPLRSLPAQAIRQRQLQEKLTSQRSSRPSSNNSSLTQAQVSKLPIRQQQLIRRHQTMPALRLPRHSTSSPTSTFYYRLPHFQTYLNKLRINSKAPRQ